MIESLQHVGDSIPWFFPSLVVVFGLCIGSFLNVCIYRIPSDKSLIYPRSACSACNTPICWYDNIPVLSYIFLRGRCRECNKTISIRYPLVEVLTAALFLFCWLQYGVASSVALMVFVSIIIVGSFVDMDHLMIPDRFTIGGFIVGIVLCALVPSLHGYTEDIYILDSFRSVTTGLIGGIVGSGVILWIALIAELLVKEEALGFGDVKLMGCVGAFCGWQGALFSIFGGAVLGSVFMLPLVLVKRLKSRDSDKKGTVIPFGPWLGMGALVYLLLLKEQVNEWFSFVENIFFKSI